MKIVVIIYSSLLALTSASFFSELASSISSVQSGIGKLISDATVDLKDTIDCSVYAVQQVFSADGVVLGYQKCQEKNNNSIPPSPSKPAVVYVTPPVTPSPTDYSRMIKPTNREQKILKETLEATDSKNLDQMEKTGVENYLSSFVNINSKLEHEFEDLSKHVTDELNKIENEQNQLPMEKITKEIDKLLENEIIDKNSTDMEIHEVYDKLSAKLDENNTDNFDLKDEIKSVLTELEQHKSQTNVEREFQVWKEKELESLDDIRNMLKKQDKINIDTIKQDRTPTNISNTKISNKEMSVTESLKSGGASTKTVPASVTVSPKRATTDNRSYPIRTTTPDYSTTTHVVHTTTRVVRTTTPVVRTTTPVVRRTTKTTERSFSNPDDYVNRDKLSIDQALKLVSESKKTASIMANILKRQKSASSVFDHPELLTETGK